MQETNDTRIRAECVPGFTFEGLLDMTGNEAEAKEREEAIKIEKKARKPREKEIIDDEAQ